MEQTESSQRGGGTKKVKGLVKGHICISLDTDDSVVMPGGRGGVGAGWRWAKDERGMCNSVKNKNKVKKTHLGFFFVSFLHLVYLNIDCIFIS